MASAPLDSIILPAPAKLNLNLTITGRRNDGMHTLITDMMLIKLFDEVTIRRRDDSRIYRRWRHPQVSAADDLCLRAARLLKTAAGGKQFGVDIDVRKNIPVGSGLGGGSSDAATVLLGLNKLWNLGWSRMRLAKLAATLGADVPFFFFGRTARASGLGGDLSLMPKQKALQAAKKRYLLLFSGVSAMTAAVYGEHRRLTDKPKTGKIEPCLCLDNDLAAAAMRLYPKIALVAKRLQQITGQAQMSGSGACLFAAFSRDDEAQRARLALAADFPVMVVDGLERHPLGSMKVKHFGE